MSDPPGAKVDEQLAMPEESGPEHSVVEPTVKLTISPSVVLPTPVTVALKVTDPP